MRELVITKLVILPEQSQFGRSEAVLRWQNWCVSTCRLTDLVGGQF